MFWASESEGSNYSFWVEFPPPPGRINTALLTIPHPRQWCRRRMMLKSWQHSIQLLVDSSCSQIGAIVKSEQLVSSYDMQHGTIW